MLRIQIEDGGASGAKTLVEDNALLVTQNPFPPFIPQKSTIFSQDFTDDGTTTGSNDMGIDGSTTAQDFWVPASNDKDRYIVKINLEIAYGSSGQPFQFADGSALTNGVLFEYFGIENTEVEINNFQDNLDLLQASKDGLIGTNWELRGVGALNDYGYAVTVDLAELMPPWGVKLGRGEDSRILMRIRDDCTAADTFKARAFGYERLEF